MALTKLQKQNIIGDLKEKLGEQKAIVFLDISGVKVKDLSRLRKEMREENCELKVAKKTLIKIAFKEKGIDLDTKKLVGEIALGFGYRDEVSVFKISYNFSKLAENLKILGGIIGKEIFDKEKALILATLPTKDELLAKLLESVSAPITNFVNVLQGNIKGLINVLAKVKT